MKNFESQQYLPFTVLKRCHICRKYRFFNLSQQYLPFTVLKLLRASSFVECCFCNNVATVLTVYGIETFTSFKFCRMLLLQSQQYLPFTVLKRVRSIPSSSIPPVATVLTVYGIETLLAQLKFSRYH